MKPYEFKLNDSVIISPRTVKNANKDIYKLRPDLFNKIHLIEKFDQSKNYCILQNTDYKLKTQTLRKIFRIKEKNHEQHRKDKGVNEIPF